MWDRISALGVALLTLSLAAADWPGGPLETSLTTALLDSDVFSQWVDGGLAPVAESEAKNGPRDVVWTKDGRPDWRGIRFGDSRSPGVRHLRIGLSKPTSIGSVLVRGGGRLSVLKAAAEYPAIRLATKSGCRPSG